MNRVIKFRAWDKQYKIMSPVTLIMFDTNEIDYASNNNEPKSMDHLEIMQFTGLHDKNGVEIYEGDLIKIHAGHENNKRIVFEVVYDTAAFQLEPKKINVIAGKTPFVNYACQLAENIEDFYDREQLPEYLEVIGNIYQNPELL